MSFLLSSTPISGISSDQDYGVTSSESSLLDGRTKRLIEINQFYRSYYQSVNDILKVLIVTFFLMMVVLYIYSLFRMFRITLFILYSIIGVSGLVYAFKLFIDIQDRNNQDFDMYQFQFRKASAPALDSTGGSITVSSNAQLPRLFKCVDGDCCAEGQIFDSTLGKCTAPASSSTATK